MKKTKEEVAQPISKFEEFITFLGSLTDEEKAKVRETLGLVQVTKVANGGSRTTGKVKRTELAVTPDKVLAKQVRILINCLPTDRAVDIKEWGDLAKTAGLETQQQPDRIAAYYKKFIVDSGYASVEN